MPLSGIQNIDLGTAGSQSGDTIRDAFNKVNGNFGLLGEIAGRNWYFAKYTTAFTSQTSVWTTGATLLSNVPGGDYLVFFSSGLKGGASGCLPNIRVNGSVDGGWGGTALLYPAPNAMPDLIYLDRVNKITLSAPQDLRLEYRRKSGSGTATFQYQQLLMIGPL